MPMIVPGLNVGCEAKEQQTGLFESHMMHRMGPVCTLSLSLSVALCLTVYTVPCGEQEVLPHIPTGDIWREDKDSQCPPLLASVLGLFQHKMEKKIQIFVL